MSDPAYKPIESSESSESDDSHVSTEPAIIPPVKPRRVHRDRKGGQGRIGRAGRPKKRPKRRPPGRRPVEERAPLPLVTPPPPKPTYRILDLVSLLDWLKPKVKCAQCDSSIAFREVEIVGQGFHLEASCKCGPKYCSSSPHASQDYEINRRLPLAMRLLGVGYEAIEIFCAIMDLPEPKSRKDYQEFGKQIQVSCQNVVADAEASVLEKILPKLKIKAQTRVLDFIRKADTASSLDRSLLFGSQ